MGLLGDSVLFAALVPWYLARGGVVRARQLIVTTVGFMVLTTAAPGPWQLARWWHEYFATVALILMGVTLVFFFQKLNNLPDNAMSSITKVTQIPHGRRAVSPSRIAGAHIECGNRMSHPSTARRRRAPCLIHPPQAPAGGAARPWRAPVCRLSDVQ